VVQWREALAFDNTSIARHDRGDLGFDSQVRRNFPLAMGICVPGAVRAIARYQPFLRVCRCPLRDVISRSRAASKFRDCIHYCRPPDYRANQCPNGWELRRSAEQAVFSGIPQPPSECRSFYVSRGRSQKLLSEVVDQIYSDNVDAMTIATMFKLPTVN